MNSSIENLSPKEIADLLQAIAAMMQANKQSGTYAVLENELVNKAKLLTRSISS